MKAKKSSDRDGLSNKKMKTSDPKDRKGTSQPDIELANIPKEPDRNVDNDKGAEKTTEDGDSFSNMEASSSRKSVKTDSSNKSYNPGSSNDEESEKQSSLNSDTEEDRKSETSGNARSERRGSLNAERRGSVKSDKQSATNSNVSGSDVDNSLAESTSNSEREETKNKSEMDSNKSDRGKSTKKPEKPKPLKIDTSLAANTNGDPPKGKSPLPSGTAMDTHPFARASVIEVLHGVDDPTEDSWWSEDSDEEAGDKTKHSIRLCDVIDRVSIGEQKWRYYVHYRDFNRRMDEWISMERIVSPPSVGNAKARAIKKEEEREKRKQQRIDERNAELRSAVDLSAPRASRRRSSINQPSGIATEVITPTAVEGDAETPRRTRLQRRKSFDDDTVVASNQMDKSGSGRDTPHNSPAVVMAAEKGVVAIPTQAATHTTVGEHVVATIPAQELDEHEGLDEASLREHEEVTKVKNVAFVELGAFQMETWYYSPLPKELLSENGLIEVLCVCEFTFAMFSRKSELRRFQSRLPSHARHPPGNEIYRNGNLSSTCYQFCDFSEHIRGF